MDKTEAHRILAALKSGTPLVSRHKSAEALEWAMGPRWISVEDRLPGEAETVIVHYRHGIEIGLLSEHNTWWTHDAYQIYNVTHWQPLPAGPWVRDE